MMTYNSPADIDAIGRGLVDKTLPKVAWTHHAHLAAAVWIIRHERLNAERDLPGIIRAYNVATGVENTDTDGYHETITLASLKVIRHFLAGLPTATALDEAVSAVIASPFGQPNWLLTYWSKARLFSAEARRVWIEPDLKPLPV